MYIDASKRPVNVLVINDKDWEEFFSVALPHDLKGADRARALRKLEQHGFRDTYRFPRQRGSLAKAQASSVRNRIARVAGIQMEVAHGIAAA